MKYLIVILTFFAIGFAEKSLAQDTTQQRQLSQLLANYYDIKDALVSDNAKAASIKANEFIKTANSIDYKIISEGNINALLKDATAISVTTDIAKQRVYFSNLSNNMADLAGVVKFTSSPIYRAYCPMKKANWLSNEKIIKNPYYGSSMLTCGTIVNTIQ